MISIIGGSGFVGTRLAKRLKRAEGADFTIVDKKVSLNFPNKVAIADVRSLEQLDAAIDKNSVIINLAAEHRDDIYPTSLYHDVNVVGAQNICQIANSKNIKKIIFTSTVAVYGFAPVGTSEEGKIAPFNEYGRSKFQAEEIFKTWQMESPADRTLVIIRPTVIFGEQNRGNVYNLLNQVSSGKFIMVGEGNNRKSMAYVENISAFIEYSLGFSSGVHIFNYVDKPDLSMNELIRIVGEVLDRKSIGRFRLPYLVGYAAGKVFDFFAFVTKKKFTISSIRVKKFCADTVFSTGIEKTGFVPPVSVFDALKQTIRYEFIESHKEEGLFYSE